MLKIAYFLGFYDAYNEYFSNKKQLFGLPDDQIITSRESLVWKIYAKKAEEKKNESSNQSKVYRFTRCYVIIPYLLLSN